MVVYKIRGSGKYILKYATSTGLRKGEYSFTDTSETYYKEGKMEGLNRSNKIMFLFQ